MPANPRRRRAARLFRGHSRTLVVALLLLSAAVGGFMLSPLSLKGDLACLTG